MITFIIQFLYNRNELLIPVTCDKFPLTYLGLQRKNKQTHHQKYFKTLYRGVHLI